MSRYVFNYCPYCKYMQNHGRCEAFEYSNYIGLPYLRCVNCKGIYSTGKKLYCSMNDQEKFNLKMKLIPNFLSILMTSIGCLSLIYFFISWILGKLNIQIDYDNIKLIILIIFSLSICIPFSIHTAAKEYRKIKNIRIDDYKEFLDNELTLINLNAINNHEKIKEYNENKE